MNTMKRGDKIMTNMGPGTVVAAFDDGVCWVVLSNGQKTVIRPGK